MKVSNEAVALPRPRQPAPAQTAAPWIAQLERAWLNDWRVQGEPASGAGLQSAAGAEGSSTTDRGYARQSTGASPEQISCQQDGGARHLIAADEAQKLSGLSHAAGQAPQGGESCKQTQPDRVKAPGMLAPPEADVAPAPVKVRTGAAIDGDQPPTRSGSPSQPHGREQLVASHSVLQVALMPGGAQVTLRDASLSSGEQARMGQALAHQLLGQGLRAVRVYVNGLESHHGQTNWSAEPVNHGDPIGFHNSSTFPSTLERK